MENTNITPEMQQIMINEMLNQQTAQVNMDELSPEDRRQMLRQKLHQKIFFQKCSP